MPTFHKVHVGLDLHPDQTNNEEPNAESIEDAHMKREIEQQQTTESMSAQSETTELDIYYCCIKCSSVGICLSM